MGRNFRNSSAEGTVSEHVTRIELSVNTFHFEVSLIQFLLQPTMPDIQMFHSSDASLVAKCSGNIGVSVQDNRKKHHSTEFYIVLHQLGLHQHFAHAHDFTFTTGERVLSSRPAVTVIGNHQPSNNLQMPTSCPDRCKPSLHREKPQWYPACLPSA